MEILFRIDVQYDVDYHSMKASDLFIKCLEDEGVEYIFGMPGEETNDLMMSLSDSKKIKLQVISMDMLYCQANNINYVELREALNTKWNVRILDCFYEAFFRIIYLFNC